MTYLGFLGVFVLTPLVLVLWRHGATLRGRGWAPLVLLLGIVYAATTPWDAAAVAMGLWRFDPDRILGPTVAGLPLEEYAFFGLQTLLTGVWALDRLRRR